MEKEMKWNHLALRDVPSIGTKSAQGAIVALMRSFHGPMSTTLWDEKYLKPQNSGELGSINNSNGLSCREELSYPSCTPQRFRSLITLYCPLKSAKCWFPAMMKSSKRNNQWKTTFDANCIYMLTCCPFWSVIFTGDSIQHQQLF